VIEFSQWISTLLRGLTFSQETTSISCTDVHEKTTASKSLVQVSGTRDEFDETFKEERTQEGCLDLPGVYNEFGDDCGQRGSRILPTHSCLTVDSAARLARYRYCML
jgi:hypothetical protein